MPFNPEKYINPYTDFGFKRLFGSEVNKDLLIDFLNELIHEQGEIVDIQYLTNEQLGRNEFERRAIFDIYCQNEHGEHFIVEMQRNKQNFFKDRSVYYATFPIQQQAFTGEWNFDLKAVYFVGILDFVFDKEDAEYCHHEVKLMDIKNKKVFYDKLTFIYLEMPKFNKSIDQLESHFDKWLYVIKNLARLQDRPVELQERVFEKLFYEAEIAKFSQIERMSYEGSRKVYWDNYAVYETCINEGYMEGKEEGRVEGRAEGIAEGRAEGKIEGITEGRFEEKIAIAKNMLKKGMSLNDIIEISGLTTEEINKLEQ